MAREMGVDAHICDGSYISHLESEVLSNYGWRMVLDAFFLLNYMFCLVLALVCDLAAHTGGAPGAGPGLYLSAVIMCQQPYCLRLVAHGGAAA